MQTAMQSEESNTSSDTDNIVEKSFQESLAPQKWRPQPCFSLSSLLKAKVYSQKIRKRRKPVLIKYRPRIKKKQNYDHPMPLPAMNKIHSQNAGSSDQLVQRIKFDQREITTIEEETFQYKKHSRRSPYKTKCYQEKVASLTVVVGRLRELCLAKPEVLQNNFTEETMKLFTRIQI